MKSFGDIKMHSATIKIFNSVLLSSRRSEVRHKTIENWRKYA
jgi:hypothetical protein